MTEQFTVQKADAFVAAHKVTSYWYPQFHIAPPVGWCNDPNGFSYFQGKYHFFYQYYPYEPKWGPMHWGHVTSEDLVHWQHEKTALAPDQTYDAGGCFTGSGWSKDGKLYLLYTGHVDLPKHGNGPDRIETQCVAFTNDGLNFQKIKGNPAIKLLENISTGEDHHFRDPKIWQHGDTYYAVVGAQTEEETGQVLLFSSHDLEHWSFKSVMAMAKGNQGFMWECPNFAEFDGQEALILSPQGVKPEGHKYLNLHQSVLMFGKMDYRTGIFQHDDFQLLDYGFDFYAPQILQAPDGRCLMVGWLDMWESMMPEQKDNWAGQMTILRELHFDGEKLLITPAKELKQLRQNAYEKRNVVIKNATTMPEWNHKLGEICLHLDLKQADGWQIVFAEGTQAEVSLQMQKCDGVVTLTRKSLKTGQLETRWSKALEQTNELSLNIYEDASSLEFFINDGEVVLSTRFYPQNDDERTITIKSLGGAVTMKQGTFNTLKSIF